MNSKLVDQAYLPSAVPTARQREYQDWENRRGSPMQRHKLTIGTSARAVAHLFCCAVLIGLLGAFAPAAAAPPPLPPPVKCGVERLDGALRPEGGTFHLALTFTKEPKASQVDGALTMTPSFADGWGRIFWAGEPVAVVPGDARTPGRVEMAVPYPPLPPGGYVFRGIIRDAAGATVTTVEAPMGRFEHFDFQRDLVWLYWGGGPASDAMARTLLDLGINGNGGVAPDHRFPYTWFRDHAAQVPMERYPEDLVRNPKGTNLGNFGDWTGWMAHEGGLALVLMTDEIDAKLGDPAMRAVRLRLARRNAWMNIPTISRFNAFFRTDFLSWDEALRDGFSPLDHPQFKGAPIGWTADRDFRDIETPMMRSALIRQATPTPVFGPGATHCLVDGWADSFNSRAYNQNTTLDSLQRFISTQPTYGLRPGNKLCNLKPGYLAPQGAYWEAHEHQYWTALACNDRMFLIYGPGDGYGAAPATADGKVTPEGKGFQAIRNLIHPLRPTILSTRSQVDPAVLYLEHYYYDGGRNLMDGLVANGIIPLGAKAPGPEAKLIFAIDTGASTAVLDAVRTGAGLVCNGDQAALGIVPPTNAPATTWQEIDLTPLAKAFPGLAGVKVMGSYRGDARAKAGSGFEEVRVGDQLLAITGSYGKGWVLYLNFDLQNMALPNGYRGSWGATLISLLADASIPERNAALVRALLARAGVPERVRVTDRKGNVAPFVRAFAAETADRAQQYLYVVSEPVGTLKKDPVDSQKDVLELACENPLTGDIRILDPSIKAVRDLRTGKLLPLKAVAQGVAVDYSLVPGQGTILSLLTAPPAGKLSVQLSQTEVAGVEVVHAEVCRRGADGTPLALPGHALWVRCLDPQGREVEALTRWATGGGPHVFTVPFALNDPEGEWTVVAEDQTDGTRTETKLRRQGKAAGLRLALTPNSPLVRGAATPGVLRVTNPGTTPLSLEGATLACATLGVRVTAPALKANIPAGGTADVPVSVEVDPAAPAGPGLLTLRRGEALLGGARFDIPAPYTVTLDSTPYLDGDLILTEIRGTLQCSAAGPTPVTLRLPANPAGAAREVTVTSPKAYAEVPFAFPLWMTRAQAQAVCGQRYEGVELTMTAPGLPADHFRYIPNILPLDRAPQRIGSLAGGTVTVKINNFTRTAQQVAIMLAALPGESGKAWQASKAVAPQTSDVLERVVAGLPALTDPGLYDVALDWRVGNAAQAATSLPVEMVAEQEWWVRFEPSTPPANQPAPASDAVPTLPASVAERDKAGWRRVVTQSVLWWEELAPPKSGPGRMYAAARFEAPQPRPIRAGFTGPAKPARLWVNGALLEFALPNPTGNGKAPADPVVMSTTPVTARQGANSVVFAFDVPTKTKSPGTSLVLQDPATGKRDRSLKIGVGAGTADGKQ